MDFNPLSSACELECVVCLCVVVGCWGDCAYYLQKTKVEFKSILEV